MFNLKYFNYEEIRRFNPQKVKVYSIYGRIKASADTCNTVTLYSDRSSDPNVEDDSGWTC